MRGIADFHAGQGSDQALVVEDSLQGALGNLRLVGGVGGVELTAPQDRIDCSRDVVVISAGAQEADQLSCVSVGISQLLHLGQGFHLGQGGRQTQAGEAMRGGHGLEQVFQAVYADSPSISSRSAAVCGIYIFPPERPILCFRRELDKRKRLASLPARMGC